VVLLDLLGNYVPEADLQESAYPANTSLLMLSVLLAVIVENED
jgi:hypothetical protein